MGVWGLGFEVWGPANGECKGLNALRLGRCYHVPCRRVEEFGEQTPGNEEHNMSFFRAVCATCIFTNIYIYMYNLGATGPAHLVP